VVVNEETTPTDAKNASKRVAAAYGMRLIIFMVQQGNSRRIRCFEAMVWVLSLCFAFVDDVYCKKIQKDSQI